MPEQQVIATLAAGLTSGQTYTSLNTGMVQDSLGANQTITLGWGSGTTQQVVTSAAVSAGAYTIPVTSFVASATFGIGTLVGDPSSSGNTPAVGSVQRVNAGYLAPGQTQKNYTGTVSITTGATVTLETVTAGKTYIVTDIYIGANTAQQFQVNLKSAGTDIFVGFCKGDTGPIQMPGIETQPSASAGSAVTLVFSTAAATTASYAIFGMEQ